MTMNTKTPICRNCKHHKRIRDIDVCVRPISSKVSLVTGETVQTFTNLFCGSQRREVSRLERLFDCDVCGKEGRHFLPTNEKSAGTDASGKTL